MEKEHGIKTLNDKIISLEQSLKNRKDNVNELYDLTSETKHRVCEAEKQIARSEEKLECEKRLRQNDFEWRNFYKK
jgi:SMC interacting uncharacterized protein involved in chromosome segregation